MRRKTEGRSYRYCCCRQRGGVHGRSERGSQPVPEPRCHNRDELLSSQALGRQEIAPARQL